MSTTPTSPKVTVPVLAGAVTALLVYVLNTAVGVDVPPEVSSAITLVIMGAAGWLKRDPLRGDGYEPRHDAKRRA